MPARLMYCPRCGQARMFVQSLNSERRACHECGTDMTAWEQGMFQRIEAHYLHRMGDAQAIRVILLDLPANGVLLVCAAPDCRNRKDIIGTPLAFIPRW